MKSKKIGSGIKESKEILELKEILRRRLNQISFNPDYVDYIQKKSKRTKSVKANSLTNMISKLGKVKDISKANHGLFHITGDKTLAFEEIIKIAGTVRNKLAKDAMIEWDAEIKKLPPNTREIHVLLGWDN